MKKIKRNLPITAVIRVVFIISMLVSIAGIGFIMFSGWINFSKKTFDGISKNIANQIYEQVESFISIPKHVNKINHMIIENDILDLTDSVRRSSFFAGVLNSHSEKIHSFSYGSSTGLFYGARRNSDNNLELMINDSSTSFNSHYYSVNDDLTPGSLLRKNPTYDPRTRDWYMAAVNSGVPTYSPVFKHHSKEELTLSSAWPVYGKSGALQGVMATHMFISDIDIFLNGIVNEYNGFALVVEQDSCELIASSIGTPNFTTLEDGTVQRHTIYEIQDERTRKICDYYTETSESSFDFKIEGVRYYTNIQTIEMDGLKWVLISAIPSSIYTVDLAKNAHITLGYVFVIFVLSLLTYSIVLRRLFRPLTHLHEISTAFSTGNFAKRIKVKRNDEIGGISESFNIMAENMQFLIQNLEEIVDLRTDELHKSSAALEESKNQLQLILSSTAEGVCGIDIEGKCTFCNLSGLRLLGYKTQEEILGKDAHALFHHSYHDGTPYPVEECGVYNSLKDRIEYKNDNEVFWRSDGSYFYVEYFSHPLVHNGEVIGGVITFLDITDRKEKEDEINYLSYHDALTGLYNRRGFEDHLSKIDIPNNLPISVIFGDINGLKMTNDIFGHSSGDELIKKSAEILTSSCREKDIVARVGGDEFILLLPKTKTEHANKVLERIKAGFDVTRIDAIKCSISVGSDTKSSPSESLEEVIANAENAMYRDKTMNRREINQDIIDTIIETLHKKSPEEKRHSTAVRDMCEDIGKELNLSAKDISRLMRAAYLHDLGKITQDEAVLQKTVLTDEEQENMRQHSVDGYRILSLFDDTVDLAEYVYSHHEHWDGNGYPRGLKGHQIPQISRIIAVAETYDRRLHRTSSPQSDRQQLALKAIQDGSGSRFDPEIVDILIKLVSS